MTTRKKFPLTPPDIVFPCKIFSVREQIITSEEENVQMPIFTFSCADWVNVVPVTGDGKMILVEQHRFGSDTFTIETPGGAVDKGEKDHTMSALREMEEETGYTSQRILSLASPYANPALQTNRISYFLALDVTPMSEPSTFHDPFEKIEVKIIDVNEAILMARRGQIASALSAFAILLAEPYIRQKFPKMFQE